KAVLQFQWYFAFFSWRQRDYWAAEPARHKMQVLNIYLYTYKSVG
ncbi:MAG: hypothetical protein ACI9CE_002671, partial [Flavobacterium sp.]